MALSTVVGSSGSGKSTYLYEKILNEAMKNKNKNYLIIVPEQYTMSTQRLLVKMHQNHCIMNIDVLSFNRLAYRVFEELGINAIGVLDDIGKSLVLRKLVDDHIDELGALRKNMTRISYITQVKSLISEMTQYNITPEVLKQMIDYAPMSESFRLKAADLLILYEAFLQYIDGKYVTTESILSRLNEVLDSSEMVNNSVIVLDGFTGFTPIQYQLTEHFLKICDEVIVSITADNSESVLENKSDDDIFKMSSDFIRRLNHIASNAKCEINEPVYIDGSSGRFCNNACFSHLEHSIFRADRSDAYKGDDATDRISLSTLKNPREELRYAAIQINKYVRTGNYKYKDFAVVCPNLEQYRYIVEGIWKEYDIPFFIDSKTEILFHPFVEALDAVFDMFRGNFRSESVFRFLKSGFCNISREDIDIFENYVISTGIRGKNKYFHPFAIRSNTFKEDENLIRVNAIREQFIGSFIAFDKAVSESNKTVGEYASALYSLITSFSCEEKIKQRGKMHELAGRGVKAKEYSQIYKVVMDMLDKMVAILNDEQMDLEEFSEIFKAGVASASIGVIPPANDSVIIGDMERTRIDGIKVLFLVGASDDAIPKKVENGGILSQLEREQLLEQFEMAPSDRQKTFRQRFYLYLMLTKPKEKLIVTSPRVDGGGKAVRVSYLMDTLEKMFEKVEITNIEEFDFGDRLLSSESAKKVLIQLIQKAARESMDSLDIREKEILSTLFAWAKQSGSVDIKKIIETAFFVHQDEMFSEEVLIAINEAFNEDETVSGSVSKFELYSGCAYSYFLNYILRLSEREQFELSAIDMGNFYHQALEEYGRLVKADGIKWSEINEDQIQTYIEVAIRKTFESMGKVATLEDPTQRYIVDTMKTTLKHTVDILTEQIRRSTFEPEYFEQSIDTVLMDEETGEPVANLRGKVDRIDISEGETSRVRIVDYKSSAHKLDLDACYHGLSIQLPIYMGVVLEKLKHTYPDANLQPSAMLYFSTKNPFVEQKVSENSLKEERLKLSKLDGLVSLDEEDIFANDKTIAADGQTTSSVVPLKLTSKGNVDNRGSHAIESEDMNTVIDYSRYKASEVAKSIIGGHYECKPSKLGDKTPCTYCSFRSVCHFDENVAGFEVNDMQKYGDEVIDMMKESLGYLKGDENNGLD